VNRGEKKLFGILKPKVYVDSICNINLKKLKKVKNIKGIIVDLDNTLIAWGGKEIDSKIYDWIKEAKRLELKLCIVSNTNSKRISEFAEIFKIPYSSNSFYLKPFNTPFIRAIEILDTTPSETMVIGELKGIL